MVHITLPAHHAVQHMTYFTYIYLYIYLYIDSIFSCVLIWPLVVIVHFVFVVSATSTKVPVRFSSLCASCSSQNYRLIARQAAYNV